MASDLTPIIDRNRPSQQRARVACYRCHEKKVRCNAFEQSPCSGCTANSAECVLITSQRGRYARKRGNHHHIATVANTTRTIGQDPEQQNEGSVQPETGLEGHEADRCIRHDPSAITQNTAIQQPENPVYASGQDPGSLPNQADSDSPEMLYAQIAERTVSANGETIRHFGESYFLGETFSLTYVVHDVLAPFLSKAPLYQKRLHFPIAANKRTLPQQPCPPERGNIASGQVDLLKRQGLYSRPPRKVMDHLLRLYFDHFHPAFPIVDKTKYFHAAQAEQESQFVLNAVLMIAVTHCHKDVLVTFGCEDRHAARSTFYRQARCLYDSDAEHDKLNTIRGLFLMSFWWGGPNEQKDSWHWLAIAISLAQSLGLHRSTETSRIDPAQATEWKLLWWSLRIRDVLVSASIGRPQHIWQGDCDVGQPGEADVSRQLADSDAEVSNYFIQTAKLSAIVSGIITSRYSCSPSLIAREDRVSLEGAMSQFQAEMPQELRFDGLDPDSGRGIWTAMLNMSYNYAMILLCRPTRTLSGEEQLQTWGNPRKAIAAANSITRTTEDLLSTSMIELCQVHTIAALFNALAMHISMICGSDPVNKGLAETRARVCMMGLGALQEAWPVGTWVLKLFDSIMARLKVHVPTAANVTGSSSGRRSLKRKQNAMADVDASASQSRELATTPDTSSPGDRSRLIHHRHTSHAEDPQVAGGHQSLGEPDADGCYFTDGLMPLTFAEMDHDLVSSMFAFDESIDRTGVDQGNFFHWLDFASLQGQEPTQHQWSG